MTSKGHESGKPLRAGDPRELDGYRVVSRLGRGGMGTVYLAEDSAGHPVAVKLIHPDLADDESFRRRFAREVDAARRVARFSTAGVIDARLEGEPLFIVSEYVPGPNLDEAVRHGEPMRGGTLDGLAMGVAAALTAIHGSGVIHRDLKPANVLLSPVGPKVIDFGIARALDDSSGGITRSSQLMGTPSYMAPELILGEQATPAADIFAWGCLVAFAGTGRAPFDAATVPAVLHNISSAEPRLDGLDPSLLDLVGSTLDKNPDNRPTSQQLLARLTGQESPEESVVRRTISTSWAPPSSAPVAGTPPQETVDELPREEAAPPPTAVAPTLPAPDQGRVPTGGSTPPGGQNAAPQPHMPGPYAQRPPSGPQEAPAHPPQAGHPYGARPQGPGQGQGPYAGGPQGPGHGGWHNGGHPVPTHQGGHPGPSPAHGQPAFGAHSGPGGPGGPGTPGGPGSAPENGGSGGRRRLMLIGGGATALVLVAVIGGAVLFSGSSAPPENTTSLYSHDFATDPGWSSYEFDPQDPDTGQVSYWGAQNAMMLWLDPASGPSRGSVVPYERETPDGILVRTTMIALEGPGESTSGVRCWDQEDDERTTYEALLRFDGAEAQIRRVTEESGDNALASTTDVGGFRTYDLFDEESDVEGLPYRADLGDLVTNEIALSCEYVVEDDQDPYMDLRMWVNDELVLQTKDDQPLPDDSSLDDEERRRVGIVLRPGAANDPIGAAYTDYSLYRIDPED
ncbi:protein kinase domain-containing protein [Nocardiopsis alba]